MVKITSLKWLIVFIMTNIKASNVCYDKKKLAL
jgi:hypothetical protein